ncbi:MAG: universal stress protein [Planctomycetota bacterium]|jgi:nucleotide-binding universal stress UspA family protein
MIKRILIALSGTPFTRAAVQHTVELAQRHGAETIGVTDVDLAKLANVGPVPVGAGAAAHELVEHRIQLTEQHIEESIRHFESACSESGIPHSVVRESGNPFDKLISLWRYCDLTVAGLRGLFEYGVVHNPDDMIIRLVARGVRPILAVAKEYRPIRRVLVAYNGSMESAKALKRFVQSRLWPDLSLRIVCFDVEAEEGEPLLADAVRYCTLHGYDAEHERVEDSPRERLLEYAQAWNADLIVMGSSSRARIIKHLLGDTALHALRHAEIPLFLTQ